MQLQIRWAGAALLAVAIFTLVIDTSFARGDLFDDDYYDCPSAIRLSEGQITSLTVARNPKARSKVDVSWTATDPDTWGLGPNAYNALFAIILDDKVKDPVEKTATLGTRSVTFENVATHAKAEVQMAVVVAGESDNFVASDILQVDLVEGLSASRSEPLERPSFSSSWRYQDSSEDDLWGIATTESPDIPNGEFYYIGYNHDFVNYLAMGDNIVTRPDIPRLRIGLRHEENTDAESLDMVGFKSYRISILDGNGDQVATFATVRSDPGLGSDYTTVWQGIGEVSPGVVIDDGLLHNCFSLDDGLSGADKTFYNVRVLHDGVVYDAEAGKFKFHSNRDELAFRLTAGGADVPGVAFSTSRPCRITQPEGFFEIYNRHYVEGVTQYFPVGFYAPNPDEHSDFPVDVMDSSETFTLQAWAVNHVGESLSTKASLKVRTDSTRYGAGTFRNLLNSGPSPDFPPIPITGSTVTQFTVIKSD